MRYKVMIKITNKTFVLTNKQFSYVIEIDKFAHVTSKYIGHPLREGEDINAFIYKEAFAPGSSLVYDEEVDPHFSYDQWPLEVATYGKGDYREPSIAFSQGGQELFDFKYVSHEVLDSLRMEVSLPTPHNITDVIIIKLEDKLNKVELYLQYGLSETALVRNVKLVNKNEEPLKIRRLMSMNLDIPNNNYILYTPYGAWISENNIARKPLTPGVYVHEAKTGSSSAKHNPFSLLIDGELGSTSGNGLGFNFLYSGSHYSSYELTTFDNVRIQIGLNPADFHPTLEKDEALTTPFVVLTFSDKGQNGVSQNLHKFTVDHVLRPKFARADRPIVINNWEATYFSFTEKKIKAIIDSASEMGMELFCLDDGWFGRRSDDTKGLGDWVVNPKKLPKGLASLAKYANKKGLKFGLWFEPEMVNIDSKLYENHPEWMIKVANIKPSSGRHQYVLDLSLKEVQDYIIDSVTKILKSADITYVKWDFNRVLSDLGSIKTPSNRLTYDYYLGLYRVLDVLTTTFPDVLFENCASGGGRFDLGMLSYFDQTWTSDNTDAVARLAIQSGTALAYPLVTISNHVSDSPSHSMLRNTPLHTRFNVAAFGVLGYELDLSKFRHLQKDWTKQHIELYKEHRSLLQHGTFYQLETPLTSENYIWSVVSEDKKEAIVGYYQLLNSLIKGQDRIKLAGLDDDLLYDVKVIRQDHEITMFGGLVSLALPKGIDMDGKIFRAIAKRKSAEEFLNIGTNETYVVSGYALNRGALLLNPQWRMTGVSEKMRILGDYGSTLIHIKARK